MPYSETACTLKDKETSRHSQISLWREYERNFQDVYGTTNTHLETDGLIYRQMKIVYDTGYASREEILNDARLLDLDTQLIAEFFDPIEADDEDEEDTELISCIIKR